MSKILLNPTNPNPPRYAYSSIPEVVEHAQRYAKNELDVMYVYAFNTKYYPHINPENTIKGCLLVSSRKNPMDMTKYGLDVRYLAHVRGERKGKTRIARWFIGDIEGKVSDVTYQIAGVLQ